MRNISGGNDIDITNIGIDITGIRLLKNHIYNFCMGYFVVRRKLYLSGKT